jgi:broad specificity phosphatase PhoE
VVAREAEAQRASDVVLVGHGTAWTVLVAALTHRPPDVDAWRGLHMPDHCALELALDHDDEAAGPGPATAHVIRPWGSWATP